MSESESQRSPRERQVDALIAEYYQSIERGAPLDQADFLAAQPGSTHGDGSRDRCPGIRGLDLEPGLRLLPGFPTAGDRHRLGRR